jgi:acyl carrier protein
MYRYLFVLAFLLLACAYRVLRDRQIKAGILRSMADRPAFSDAEFAETFFAPEHVAVAAEIHAALHRYLPYDISRVQPSDRLVEDLQLTRFYRSGIVTLLMELEEKYGVRLRHRPGTKIETVGDLVDAVAAQQTHNAAS